MLNIFYGHDNLIKNVPCVLALGFFDGFHKGHEELIKTVKERKEGCLAGIMTLTGGKGKSLYTLEERLSIYEKEGFDFAYIIEFTDEVKNTDGKDFIKNLLSELNVKTLVFGYDFTCGKGGKFNADDITHYCEECGISCRRVDKISLSGVKVSSSYVKSLIAEGLVERANELLSEPFSVTAKVIHGRRQGRKFGFPTANMIYPDEKFSIKEGVYTAYAIIDGVKYGGIANYGTAPTFDYGNRLLETHFKDYSGDLYSKVIKVYLTKYLRPITKFSCVQELKAQLTEDLTKV